MDLLLRIKEERIINNINEMLKKTNKFSHKNALMYGIVGSSTYYYVIVGILRNKGLIYFKAGIPHIDKKKWHDFLSQYNEGKVGFYFRKPLAILKKNSNNKIRDKK